MKMPDILQKRVSDIVVQAVANSPENRLRGFVNEPAWDAPLVGFASGDDPLFQFLKEDIGSFYWAPADVFVSGTPAKSAVPAGLTVISWVIPQTERTKADQRAVTRYPSTRWTASRAYWSEFTRDVHRTVVGELGQIGIRAVAPEMMQTYSLHESNKYGFACSWSQRHTAHVAGLGTFGLSDGLITRAGVAMRAGSVVAECVIEPTERPYTNHFAWCPYLSAGECGECIARCPAGAISRAGHDKNRCERYLFHTIRKRTEAELGNRSAGCGLCQAGVPCESGIPPAR